MKYIFKNLSGCFLFVALSFSVSIAQSPGAIDVENNTDCAIRVTVFLYSGGTCPPTCGGNPTSHSGTAAANTTTTIHSGTGLTGQWGKISMDTGNLEEAGPCASSSDGCDCNGSDIKIEMDNCSLAIISLE